MLRYSGNNSSYKVCLYKR